MIEKCFDLVGEHYLVTRTVAGYTAPQFGAVPR